MDLAIKTKTASTVSVVSQNGAAVTNGLDLKILLQEVFMVLSIKEKDVVTRRFNLNNKKKETLEQIGKDFKVTRERIRQIEKVALSKLRRIIPNTQLGALGAIARQILVANGGVMVEKAFFVQVLEAISSEDPNGANIIQLSLMIDSELSRHRRSRNHRAYWRVCSIQDKTIDRVLEETISFLDKKSDVVLQDMMIDHLLGVFATEFRNLKLVSIQEFLISVLAVDLRLMNLNNSYGLVSWRHINPRSIRDKAYVVLKKSKKPLHFREIAQQIAKVGLKNKNVTLEAIHNELIRSGQFVLVGRGMYALKDWGYVEGTVADIIEALLREKMPLTKQEIVDGVLRQRMVKKGTISLNLQKYSQFERVGRAVYVLNEKKKRK